MAAQGSQANRRAPAGVLSSGALQVSAIRLTLGVYTHVELHDQTAAIESLPAPPGAGDGGKDQLQGDAA